VLAPADSANFVVVRVPVRHSACDATNAQRPARHDMHPNLCASAVQMADLPAAEVLLEELRLKSYDAGVAELQDTADFAKSKACEGEIMNWDSNFWGERLKEERFAIKDELFRPYFALPHVLEGLFGVRSLRRQTCTLRSRAVEPLWPRFALPHVLQDLAGVHRHVVCTVLLLLLPCTLSLLGCTLHYLVGRIAAFELVLAAMCMLACCLLHVFFMHERWRQCVVLRQPLQAYWDVIHQWRAS
jgi:Peptidase family M3